MRKRQQPKNYDQNNDEMNEVGITLKEMYRERMRERECAIAGLMYLMTTIKREWEWERQNLLKNNNQKKNGREERAKNMGDRNTINKYIYIYILVALCSIIKN